MTVKTTLLIRSVFPTISAAPRSAPARSRNSSLPQGVHQECRPPRAEKNRPLAGRRPKVEK